MGKRRHDIDRLIVGERIEIDVRVLGGIRLTGSLELGLCDDGAELFGEGLRLR